MYERTSQPLLKPRAFMRRAAGHLLAAVIVIVLADALGTLGYHLLAGLGWVDAFLNASMILGGMGPVDRLDSSAAKVFAALYALFSGLLFIAVVAVILAPWAHRLLHTFHVEGR